jgi:DnaJ-class molecular chaperone
LQFIPAGQVEGALRSINPGISRQNKKHRTNITMKKKLIIASIVAAFTATSVYAAVMCHSCDGTGWRKLPGNNVTKCVTCGGDGVIN